MTDALPGAPRDEGKAPPGDSNIGRQQRREGLRTAKAYRRERAFFKLSPRSAAMADADALMKKADKRRVRSARGRGEARLGLAGLARMTPRGMAACVAARVADAAALAPGPRCR